MTLVEVMYDHYIGSKHCLEKGPISVIEKGNQKYYLKYYFLKKSALGVRITTQLSLSKLFFCERLGP